MNQFFSFIIYRTRTGYEGRNATVPARRLLLVSYPKALCHPSPIFNPCCTNPAPLSITFATLPTVRLTSPITGTSLNRLVASLIPPAIVRTVFRIGLVKSLKPLKPSEILLPIVLIPPQTDEAKFPTRLKKSENPITTKEQRKKLGAYYNMACLAVTSAGYLDTNTYSIPMEIRYSAFKVRSVSILNEFDNVTNHTIYYSEGNKQFQTTIATGYYSFEDYAYVLQAKLNTLSGGNNWQIFFDRPSMRFYMTFQNNTANDVSLQFDSNSSTFTGFNSGSHTFPANNVTSFESEDKVTPSAGFYVVKSSNLSPASMMYNGDVHSGVIAIVPISNGSGQYSQWSNEDYFYLTSTHSESSLYNQLNLRIYLGDSTVPLENPQFQIQLQFQ